MDERQPQQDGARVLVVDDVTHFFAFTRRRSGTSAIQRLFGVFREIVPVAPRRRGKAPYV